DQGFLVFGPIPIKLGRRDAVVRAHRATFPREREMDTPTRRGHLIDLVWLMFWGALSSAWCLTAADRLSSTYDEPTYLKLGLLRWRTGSTGALLKLGTMPLPVDVQTLPLFLYERWRGEPFAEMADQPWLLPWARAANLLFWWLLLFY